jgi:hypothetical protein
MLSVVVIGMVSVNSVPLRSNQTPFPLEFESMGIPTLVIDSQREGTEQILDFEVEGGGLEIRMAKSKPRIEVEHVRGIRGVHTLLVYAICLSGRIVHE